MEAVDSVRRDIFYLCFNNLLFLLAICLESICFKELPQSTQSPLPFGGMNLRISVLEVFDKFNTLQIRNDATSQGSLNLNSFTATQEMGGHLVFIAVLQIHHWFREL